jgi:hypothetical protein
VIYFLAAGVLAIFVLDFIGMARAYMRKEVYSTISINIIPFAAFAFFYGLPGVWVGVVSCSLCVAMHLGGYWIHRARS